MPHTLIILENHADAGARQFLTKHAQDLKDLGYKKILLEIDKNQNLDAYVNFMMNTIHVQRENKENFQLFIEMYLKFKSLGFTFECIDPESLAENHQFIQKLATSNPNNDKERFLLAQQREEATKLRDKSMITSIVNASQFSEGVIFLGGLAHVHLVQQLTLNNAVNKKYRYALIGGGAKMMMDDAHNEQWLAFSNAGVRHQYYGTDKVHFFDIQQSLSFEMFSAVCQLTRTRECLDYAPSIKADFNQKTGIPFKFFVDEQQLVTASIEVENETERQKVFNAIQRNFTGLAFFIHTKTEGKQIINVPGMNLRENSSLLKKGLGFK